MQTQVFTISPCYPTGTGMIIYFLKGAFGNRYLTLWYLSKLIIYYLRHLSQKCSIKEITFFLFTSSIWFVTDLHLKAAGLFKYASLFVTTRHERVNVRVKTKWYRFNKVFGCCQDANESLVYCLIPIRL